MASEVEVANLAAVLIGTEARITSLDDDRFVARTLKAVWSTERQATLRDGSWNFAARRAALAAATPDPAVVTYPYTSAFPLPAAALRLIEVLDPAARDDYQLEDRNILCSVPAPLYVRYAIDRPELALWDAAAAEAFAARLAWKCGKRIAGSEFDVGAAWKFYQVELGRAKHVDAIENPPIDQEESSWITARLGSGYNPAKLG